MTPDPELPEPVHADTDSMLRRKFGREVANYFSGRFKSSTGVEYWLKKLRIAA